VVYYLIDCDSIGCGQVSFSICCFVSVGSLLIHCLDCSFLIAFVGFFFLLAFCSIVL